MNARVTRHLKTQIHTLALPSKERTNTGPVKSTPVYVNARSSLTLNSGNGGGGGLGYGVPSCFLQMIYLYDSPRQAPGTNYPSNFSFLHSIVEHTRMSILNDKSCECMISGKHYWIGRV